MRARREGESLRQSSLWNRRVRPRGRTIETGGAELPGWLLALLSNKSTKKQIMADPSSYRATRRRLPGGAGRPELKKRGEKPIRARKMLQKIAGDEIPPTDFRTQGNPSRLAKEAPVTRLLTEQLGMTLLKISASGPPGQRSPKNC